MDGWTKQRVMAIARMACTLAASVLAGFGIATDADALYCGVMIAAALASYLWSWWCNNNVTDAANEAQEYLNSIKRGDEQ